MRYLMSKEWWEKAGTRAIKTFFQAFVASVGTAYFFSEVNWIGVLSASALAGVLSLATSLAGLPELEENKDE